MTRALASSGAPRADEAPMLPTPILHQYDSSPFSEKIRKVFAIKGLAWSAVEQPPVMPKPELVPLTGGYRRIPVLQLGAEVYGDSQLVAATVERLFPGPTLYPGRSEGTCLAWSLWADRQLFLPCVAAVFATIGPYVPQAFLDDRSRMMPGRNFAEIPAQAPHARAQIRALAASLEAQLVDGRPFLLGEQPSLADASCWHPLWFLRAAPPELALLDGLPWLEAWRERMDGLGSGVRSDLPAAEALRLARDSTPELTPGPVDAREPEQLAPGQRVTVTADDYAFDPVAGLLLRSDAREIALHREEPELGSIVVHFPRVGYRVERAA